MHSEGYTDDPGWFVDTRLGRTLLSVLGIAAIYFLTVWHLPDSEVRDVLRPPISQSVRTVGIAQDWGVFAPNPVSTSYRVEADVEFDDGSVVRYRFPDGEPFFGAYREFRWRKYESRVRKDENRRRWSPTAQWIETQFPGQSVAEVRLVRRERPVPEPGTDEQTEWTDETFYTYRSVADSNEADSNEADSNEADSGDGG